MPGRDKIIEGARFYVGGYNVSNDILDIGKIMNNMGKRSMSSVMTTAVGKYIKGKREVGLEGVRALLNDEATGAYTLLQNGGTSRLSLLFGSDGAAPVIGDPAYLIGAIQFGDVINIDDGRAVIDGDFMPDSAQAAITSPSGVVLHPETSLSATTNGTSVDNLASSANGGRANLHVLATAAGNFALKVQDSPDDAAWADLITFSADGSAITSEEGTVAGTVDQYTRFQATRTGGSCTPVCTFSRN